MKRNTFARNSFLSLAGVALAVAASSASAAPVTEWGYAVNSGFSSFTPASPSVTPSNNNVALGLPSLLTWGTDIGNGQSSLGVGAATNGLITGSLVTGAAPVNTVQVIHDNNAIQAPSLSTATLLDVITLWSTAPNMGSPLIASPLIFSINFLETSNDGSCEVPSPAGNPCNDIFAIDVAGAGFNPADNSLNQTFWYDGEDYNAILHITGLGVLSNGACDAVFGNTSHRGCIGFTTIENQTNVFQVSLQITDTPYVVPEPAALALVGLGLLGLGITRRRRQAA